MWDRPTTATACSTVRGKHSLGRSSLINLQDQQGKSGHQGSQGREREAGAKQQLVQVLSLALPVSRDRRGGKADFLCLAGHPTCLSLYFNTRRPHGCSWAPADLISSSPINLAFMNRVGRYAIKSSFVCFWVGKDEGARGKDGAQGKDCDFWERLNEGKVWGNWLPPSCVLDPAKQHLLNSWFLLPFPAKD